MFPNAPSASRARRIFDSVFGPAAFNPTPNFNFSKDAPTAPATPVFGFSPSSSVAGHQHQHQEDEDEDEPSEQELSIWDQAWRAATNYLSIEDRGFAELAAAAADKDENGEVDEEQFLRQWGVYDPPDRETGDALAYILTSSSSSLRERMRRRSSLRASAVGFGSGASAGAGFGLGSKEYDLIEWYGNEMQRHFLKNFRGGLIKVRVINLLL